MTLRLALVLTGGASLGAYQAGALAALLTAAQGLLDHDPELLEVDAVGGASAGALVGMLGAHCLLEGLDPVRVLHEAWVERVSSDLLRDPEARAPLSFQRLREEAVAVLEPEHDHRVGVRQRSPITLHVALTGLQGLTYRIEGLRRDAPITATTYTDWGRFTLEPGGGVAQLLEPEGASLFDYVLASTANPGAFAPRALDRSDDADRYRDRGVLDFPESGTIWYTDGGLLQSQPLGRVLGAADRNGGRDGDRVVLMIDPRSEGPSGSQQWSDPDAQPGWTSGLSRALSILPAQALYDDLRQLEKDNSRLVWLGELVERLGPHLDAEARGALSEVLAAIDADREDMRSDEPHRERSRPDDAAAPDLLRDIVAEISGLAGKEPVAVDVISPLLLAEEADTDVPALLAGEFLGDFGGFLSKELRESDFALGYDSTAVWLEVGLARAGCDDAAIARAVREVDARRIAPWREANRGRAEPTDLPWRDRMGLLRLGIQVGRVVARSVWRGLTHR